VYSWIANGGAQPHWVHIAPNLHPSLDSFELILEGTDEDFEAQLRTRGSAHG
jgi:hypothetical protein